MRLFSDLVSWKLDNLYARLNDTLSIFMNPIRAKFLLIPAVIVSGILGICFTTLNGEEIKADDSSVEEVNSYRNPFSLPSGVSFVEKTGTVGTYSEEIWKEGVVANSVTGIFQSGNVVRANINGRWVKEGDWVGEEQIIEIETENVVLIGKEEEKRNLPLRGIETKLEVIERVTSAY